MRKYNGAILDHEGYTVFEFKTRFCATYKQAEEQAIEILDGWRFTNPGHTWYYALED